LFAVHLDTPVLKALLPEVEAVDRFGWMTLFAKETRHQSVTAETMVGEFPTVDTVRMLA
jgi:hypothetical protein